MRWSVRSLALALVVLVLAACGAGPGPSLSDASMTPAPIDNPLPSPSVEPSPSEAATPTEPVVDSVPIPPDTYARIVTDDLRIRSKPGVSEDSTKLEPLLQEGVQVVVLDGPVQASGYDWYLVQPTIPRATAVQYPFGWVAAAGKDGEPWIQSRTPGCPPLPKSGEQLDELNQGRFMFPEITCFGGKSIRFQARLGVPEARCGVEPDWGIDPSWFDRCGSDESYLVPLEAPADYAGVPPIWAPGVDTDLGAVPNAQLADMPLVEVTGMFDHPAAQTCRNKSNNDETSMPEPDPALTILRCRLKFVVTSIREIDG